MTTLDKVQAIKATGLSWLDGEYINFLERVLTGETPDNQDTAQELVNNWYKEIA